MYEYDFRVCCVIRDIETVIICPFTAVFKQLILAISISVLANALFNINSCITHDYNINAQISVSIKFC